MDGWANPALTIGLPIAGVIATIEEFARLVIELLSTSGEKPGELVAELVEKTDRAPSGKVEQPETGKGLDPFHQ